MGAKTIKASFAASGKATKFAAINASGAANGKQAGQARERKRGQPEIGGQRKDDLLTADGGIEHSRGRSAEYEVKCDVEKIAGSRAEHGEGSDAEGRFWRRVEKR